MPRYGELKAHLAETYLLFKESAETCPVGPIVSAGEHLADALRSFGYLPSEASQIVAEARQQAQEEQSKWD
jgi:Holliday junction resolvasome RuvABC DNA-binding subunit